MENSKKTDKSHFLCPVHEIQMAHENGSIYDDFSISNPDDWALAISIKDHGIREPLVITADGVLLSGHRRLSAAKLLGMDSVPVVRLDSVYFRTMDEATRLKTLRLFNQQRDKSPGEKLREKMLEIDPLKAHTDLLIRKAKILEMKDVPKSNIHIGAKKKRAAITTKQFLAKVKQVIEENRSYWPLTVRRVHYLLLNDPPLKHDKKPDSVYVNDKSSYKALTNLLSRARLTDDVPMEAIEDSTRPVQLGGGFSTFEQFVAQETEYFLSGYTRDLMQGQPHHIEIVLEKNALRNVIQTVASEYRIPITTIRGYSSISPRYELAQRYFNSGKSGLILLVLTDFDPDGQQIAESFANSLYSDFHIPKGDIKAIKVALTAEDVARHDLPSDMDAKVTSPNYKKFIQEFKTNKVVELDAAPVKLLQSKLRDAINSVIDIDEFNAQVDLEMQDAVQIEARRQVVFEAIRS